jgi:hypothetical protein
VNRISDFERPIVGKLNAFISNDNPHLEFIHTRSRASPPVTVDNSRGRFASVYRKPILKRGWLGSPDRVETIRVASGFFLDGGMIPRTAARTIDERAEARHSAVSSTAVLDFRGRKHVIRLVNISSSGAMVIFPHMPNIGERLILQLLDRGLVSAQVRWVKDGRIGVSFTAPRG